MQGKVLVLAISVYTYIGMKIFSNITRLLHAVVWYPSPTGTRHICYLENCVCSVVLCAVVAKASCIVPAARRMLTFGKQMADGTAYC